MYPTFTVKRALSGQALKSMVDCICAPAPGASVPSVTGSTAGKIREGMAVQGVPKVCVNESTKTCAPYAVPGPPLVSAMVQSRPLDGPDFADTMPLITAGGVLVKAPVTVCGLFIVRVPSSETPVGAPLKPVNTKPELGTANTVAFVPAWYQPAPGTDPPETGTACV